MLGEIIAGRVVVMERWIKWGAVVAEMLYKRLISLVPMAMWGKVAEMSNLPSKSTTLPLMVM